MISEVAILPDCFDESNDTKTLIGILKDTINNGIFIADFSIGNSGNWSNTIQELYVREFESQSLKDMLFVLIRQLKDRKKIVKLTNYGHNIVSENDWIDVVKLHHDNNSLDLVLSGDGFKAQCEIVINDKCCCINDILISDKWDELKKRDIVLKKTAESFNVVLKTMLPHVRNIQLIDPYALPKAQYKSTLELCVKYLRKKTGFDQQRGVVEIHTKSDESISIDMNKTRWKTMLDGIVNEANHTFKVYFWKDNSPEDKFHDRFILTNVFGVSSAHSFDIKDNSEQETTWSLLSKETFELHLNNFSNEDPKFQLECDPLIVESV